MNEYMLYQIVRLVKINRIQILCEINKKVLTNKINNSNIILVGRNKVFLEE